MSNLIMPLLCDFYKISHRAMYPVGTETVYSTWTPRTSRLPGITEVVWFGGQAFYKEYLVNLFNTHFFNRPKEEVVAEYSRVIRCTLGDQKPHTKHLEDLHDLRFLPLRIRALPEGTVVPTRTPVMTIENTDTRFFWLTNFIESLASSELWQPSTSATLAREYRKLFDYYGTRTVGSTDFSTFQGHDFSMRGMSSLRSAILSGMGHLTSFVGTDTIPAIIALEEYYNANIEKELVGTSVPATEHSIQCAYGNDLQYLRRMLAEVHPSGIVSIVSDGYDFWNVITSVIPALKEDILARKGGFPVDKVVIRPDSGDPVKIICGDPEGQTEHEQKGAVESLWNIFGGTVSAQGYRILDSHIGLIYGDAITLERATSILQKLASKGFASTNIVFGIGSYTYQYNTRDTFGYALKSTSCTIQGEEHAIFKDPKTDDGTKRSHKGRVAVIRGEDGELLTADELTASSVVGDNLLSDVFLNGRVVREDRLEVIRARVLSR